MVLLMVFSSVKQPDNLKNVEIFWRARSSWKATELQLQVNIEKQLMTKMCKQTVHNFFCLDAAWVDGFVGRPSVKLQLSENVAKLPVCNPQ